MFYRYHDIRYSDVAGNTLSLGNIPIRIENERVILADPSPLVLPTDPDACDTPNLSLSTCRFAKPPIDVEVLRRSNNELRRQATQLLQSRLGKRTALFFADLDDHAARSAAAFLGRLYAIEISATSLPPRSLRSSTSNPRLPTHGDPDFRTRSGRYRRVRHLDTHPRLVDSGWFTPHHFATRKDTAQ